MAKTIHSINLDDDIWTDIESQMGEAGTRSAWLNIHLRKYLMSLKVNLK